MRRLMLATVSTLTAFAFITPTLSRKASAQLFENTPPEGADPAVTDIHNDGYNEGYDAGYQDAMEGREYDSTYEGYDDDNTVEDEVTGVSRDASDDEGLNPEFEEAQEDTLFDESYEDDTVEDEVTGISRDASDDEGLNPEFEEAQEDTLFDE